MLLSTDALTLIIGRLTESVVLRAEGDGAATTWAGVAEQRVVLVGSDILAAAAGTSVAAAGTQVAAAGAPAAEASATRGGMDAMAETGWQCVIQRVLGHEMQLDSLGFGKDLNN